MRAGVGVGVGRNPPAAGKPDPQQVGAGSPLVAQHPGGLQVKVVRRAEPAQRSGKIGASQTAVVDFTAKFGVEPVFCRSIRPHIQALHPSTTSDQVMTVGSFRSVRSRMPARLLAI